MAAAVNRPPLAPEGPSGANPHVRVNADVANSTQQDPGLHSTSQDPGPSSHPQHPVFARPLFYVHAPPLPPFLQYQWPLPYNPFPGFLGMEKHNGQQEDCNGSGSRPGKLKGGSGRNPRY
ncbi:uncharacterized protein LOC100712319 isoform X3 [Oreochromis niloticus]|uniref:uncharacterized protein LOC100712319 isoform X3 n=1 Tax=Oreochromis niloticus TaxID=8128 RepID=UPI000904F737|nr:uncharacterized protein LOC100712319 isoform X3 [Oreochromis niloticus]